VYATCDLVFVTRFTPAVIFWVFWLLSHFDASKLGFEESSAVAYRLRKSVLSKSFMHILAIRSKDDHLFCQVYMGSPP
jgi:hypothetical protein